MTSSDHQSGESLRSLLSGGEHIGGRDPKMHRNEVESLESQAVIWSQKHVPSFPKKII